MDGAFATTPPGPDENRDAGSGRSRPQEVRHVPSGRGHMGDWTGDGRYYVFDRPPTHDLFVGEGVPVDAVVARHAGSGSRPAWARFAFSGSSSDGDRLVVAVGSAASPGAGHAPPVRPGKEALRADAGRGVGLLRGALSRRGVAGLGPLSRGDAVALATGRERAAPADEPTRRGSSAALVARRDAARLRQPARSVGPEGDPSRGGRRVGGRADRPARVSGRGLLGRLLAARRLHHLEPSPEQDRSVPLRPLDPARGARAGRGEAPVAEVLPAGGRWAALPSTCGAGEPTEWRDLGRRFGAYPNWTRDGRSICGIIRML